MEDFPLHQFESPFALATIDFDLSEKKRRDAIIYYYSIVVVVVCITSSQFPCNEY